VPAQHVDELQADRVAERLRDPRQPNGVLAIDVGVGDRFAAALAGGALGFGSEGQIDADLCISID
jgi:hypothetical protein